jgi:hypothetical protein
VQRGRAQAEVECRAADRPRRAAAESDPSTRPESRRRRSCVASFAQAASKLRRARRAGATGERALEKVRAVAGAARIGGVAHVTYGRALRRRSFQRVAPGQRALGRSAIPRGRRSADAIHAMAHRRALHQPVGAVGDAQRARSRALRNVRGLASNGSKSSSKLPRPGAWARASGSCPRPGGGAAAGRITIFCVDSRGCGQAVNAGDQTVGGEHVDCHVRCVTCLGRPAVGRPVTFERGGTFSAKWLVGRRLPLAMAATHCGGDGESGGTATEAARAATLVPADLLRGRVAGGGASGAAGGGRRRGDAGGAAGAAGSGPAGAAGGAQQAQRAAAQQAQRAAVLEGVAEPAAQRLPEPPDQLARMPLRTCHGTTGNATPAPPRTRAATATSAAGVGAHQVTSRAQAGTPR